MKNIHILPTDQPSRLGYHRDCKLYLHRQSLTENLPNFIPQNIYITSEEDIKDGDWYFDIFNERAIIANKYSDHKHYVSSCKKIKLTNSIKLISDGVQEVDDEFLEWYVKNPNVEFIEIKLGCLEKKQCMCDSNELCLKTGYGIIIPQEVIEPSSIVKETLEEAAENYGWRIKRNTFSDTVKANELADSAKQDFIEGANWQAEKMFKLMDLYIIDVMGGCNLKAKEWFEQNENK